jgi:undecaprenyl-diphosphatase
MIHWINNFDLKILLRLNGFFSKYNGFWDKFLAEYLTYSLPLILILLWFWNQQAKKVALKGLFSAILAWPIFALIIGKIVNRPRPFNVAGVQELVFHRPDVSFPSEHSAALFAVAMSFYLSGYKKLAYVMFTIAIVVSFFRVATGIHFPTDVIAGAVLGIIAAYLIQLFDKPLNIVYNFMIRIAKAVRLA